ARHGAVRGPVRQYLEEDLAAVRAPGTRARRGWGRGAARHLRPARGETTMKWITRERARVDRIACPWLISRFIDPTPVFLFVPASDVLAAAKREDAIPYDVPDVELGHHG